MQLLCNAVSSYLRVHDSLDVMNPSFKQNSWYILFSGRRTYNLLAERPNHCTTMLHFNYSNFRSIHRYLFHRL